MNLRSFLKSLSTTFALFVIFVLVFTYWLSKKPGNRVIYYPNRIVKELPLPTEYDLKTRSPFAWIKESYTCTEEDIISNAGVDTAVYFVFLSTVLNIFLSSGAFLLASLLSIAWNAYNGHNTFDSNLERFFLANIGEESPSLWFFLLATYVVSFFTFDTLWKAYNHVSELRRTALSAPDVKPEQYVIFVRDIPAVPEGMTRREQVDSYFESLYADEFYKSMVITDIKKVNEICKDLTKYRNKLAHAEAKFATSRTRPISKKWFLLGKKVDTINFCQKKIDTLVPKLKTEQEKTIREKQKNSALIFFKNRKAATSVAQTIHAMKDDKWTVEEAPEPRQVLWGNLGLKFYQRQLRKSIIYPIVAVTILFYMIPTMIISAYSQEMSTQKEQLLGELHSTSDKLKFQSGWAVAYLPQIVLIAILSVLPKFLTYLSKIEGIPSVSHVVRASSGKNFYFTVLNVFIGINIGVTLTRNVPTNDDKIWRLPGHIIAQNATFFVSFVAFKVAGYGLELSRLFSLILFYLKKKFFCRTEAEVKKAWAPGDMNYAFRVPDDLLIVTIVLCYSVIAPVIILFGVAYFSIGWLVLRNQALKVYIPSYESYGRMWPHMQARILAALFIFQVTMIIIFNLAKFHYVNLVVPLPLLSIYFAVWCHKKFYDNFRNTYMEGDHAEVRETPNLETIYKAYIPPCLRSEDEAQPVDDPLSVSLFQLPAIQGLL